MENPFCVIIISLVLLINIVLAKAFVHKYNQNYDSRLPRDYDDDVQNYLMEFGYLPKSNIETGNLRTVEQLKDAIRNLQKFANLPQTGVVDSETLKLMKTPRCGAPDTLETEDFLISNEIRPHRRNKRYIIQGPKWDHTKITWSLVNQTMSQQSKLDAGQVRRILSEALALWERNSRLTFQEVYSTEADIQVLFARQYHGDGYKFDGTGGILAHAFYPGSGVGGDAHFDEEEHWLLNEPDGTDGTRLFDVALHEFGHSLGLGHSSVKEAIMFPWHHISYRGKDDIPQDDRIGIQQIYGEIKIFGRNPPRTTQTTTTTTTTTTTPAPRVYYPEVNHYPKPNINPSRYNPRYSTTSSTEAPRRPNPRTEYPYIRPTTRKPYQEKPIREDYPRYQPDREHHNNHLTTRRPYQDKPNPCDTNYDAVTIIRNELFIFKGRYFWRFYQNDVSPTEAVEINRMWSGIPNDFTHIDSVYENKHRKIVFFIGKQYYVFNSNHLESGYPRPLTDLGLPESIEKIDAALVWGHNNRTYLYSGRIYWRFDEDSNHVELDYPRDMSMWKGIGYNIDSAFQYRDGKTYFFKGKGYWQFNDYRMSIAHDHKPSAKRWMKCHHAHKEPLKDTPVEEIPTSTAYRIQDKHWLLILLVIIQFRPIYF